MLGRNESQPVLFQMVDVESLVPAGHRLRKIDTVLDLSFVREAVAACYSTTRGRPSIDPELAIRMLLLATLYDLSEREVCEEVGMHVGFRWFCRLNLHDPVPDHSTLSKLKERWSKVGLFEQLFNQVVRQCAEVGLVSGRHASLDSTEVQANASMKSLKPIEPGADLRPAPADPAESPPDPSEPSGGRARMKDAQPTGAWKGQGEKYSNQTHRSTTDPDARLYKKGRKKESALRFMTHDLIDTKSRVILRRRVSHAHTKKEREVGLEMVDYVLENRAVLGLPQALEAVSADAGYGYGDFAASLLERTVAPHVVLQAGEAEEEIPTWQRQSRTLEQARKRKEKVRQARARNAVRRLSRTRGYRVSRKLRLRSEHVFAEGKERHGMGRARSRGLARVQIQMELIGAVQNLKRLAAFQRRKPRKAAAQAERVHQTNCAPPRQGRQRRLPSLGCRPWPPRSLR